MKWFGRIFVKVTGWLPGLIAFRPKIYEEDRNAHTRHIKGKAIIIANHKNISDFFIIFIVFFFKRVRTLVSELLYRHKFIAFLSNAIGNILVHRERSDLSFMGEAEKSLAKGDCICIFPEGRFVHEDDLDTFKPACVYLALRTNTPIVPVWISHNGPLTRKRVNIGKPIDLSQYCKSKIPSPEEVKALCEMLRSKVKELGHQMDLYQKYHAWNKLDFKYFTYDFIRVNAFIAQPIAFPRKYYYEEGASRKDRKIKGRAIMLSKHNGMTDAPCLTAAYPGRRMHIIVTKEAYEKIGIVKHLGTIKVNRDDGEIDAKMMIDVMNFLKCNSLVGIYPEGHITKGSVGKLASGAAYFALKTNTPIYINIPLNEFKPFKRNHIMIGKPIYPSDLYTPEEMKKKETIAKFTEYLQAKFDTLYEQLKTLKNSKK